MAEQKLMEYLQQHHVSFSINQHEPAFTAQEIAEKAHISGHRLAKTVIVKLDGQLAICVLPASERVNFSRLRHAAGCHTAELASEDEFAPHFPRYELGTIPPFGELFDLPVYVVDSLNRNDSIACNSGDSRELLQMSWGDFQNLSHPVLLTTRQKEAMS